VSQSRIESFAEVALSTASGFVISWALGKWIFPHYGWHPSHSTITAVTLWFTAASVIRSFVWRRIFENGVVAAIKKAYRRQHRADV
jgi:hypothetical protein